MNDIERSLVEREFLDDIPVDITNEANLIWDIANMIRAIYTEDKYGDVIIPMTIMRRFECALEKTKEKVVKKHKENPNYPPKAMYKISGKPFYNTSEFNLKKLCDDQDNLLSNFEAYIDSFSENIREILEKLDTKTHIMKMNRGGLYLIS